MDDLVWRAYEVDDAPAVADLINLVEEHAGGHPNATAAGVAMSLSQRVRDAAWDSRAVCAADGELAAFAVVTTPADGGYVLRLWGGVHPGYRGRGLGRELLGWQLARAAEIARAAAADGWEAHAGAMLADRSTIRLFERFGMAPARYWLDMVAPTIGAQPVASPDGFRLVPYSPEHEARLHAAHMEAFSDHWRFEQRPLEQWAPLTVRSDQFAPAQSVLAYDGDAVAGYLLAYADNDPDRLYIGQVGVRRPWRRRGVAAALLSRSLAEAARAGMTHAALGVDSAGSTGAVGVYERAGFTVESRAVTYAVSVPGN